MRRGKKKSNRPFVISFAVVFALLTISLVSLLYFSGQLHVSHLPSTVPQYETPWGKYVPSDFFQASFQNYTLTRAADPTLPPENLVFQLISPSINISSSQVNALLSVTLTVPNQTIDVAFLSPSAYNLLSTSLNLRGKYNATVGSYPLYFVAARNETTIEFGWIGLVPQDNAAAFTLGFSSAESALAKVINTVEGNILSMTSLSSVNEAAYIAGQGSGSLAVGFENFPGVVRTSNLTGIFVGYQGGLVTVSNVVGFNSTVKASAQYDYTKSVYRSFTKFTVYDSFINVQGNFPYSQLQQYIRSVGGA